MAVVFSQGPQTIEYELIDMRKNWSINSFYCQKNLTKKYSELNLKIFDNRLKSCFCQKTEADNFGVILWHLELKLIKKGHFLECCSVTNFIFEKKNKQKFFYPDETTAKWMRTFDYTLALFHRNKSIFSNYLGFLEFKWTSWKQKFLFSKLCCMRKSRELMTSNEKNFSWKTETLSEAKQTQKKLKT